MIENVVKRDGSVATFDIKKIINAIYKALKSVGSEDYITSKKLAEKVVKKLEIEHITTPKVEEIQDIIEEVLMVEGYTKVAKAYIIYREKRKL
ncbi:MAG: ATP cone domain-containing protein, partial [Thermoplasmata archaeon]